MAGKIKIGKSRNITQKEISMWVYDADYHGHRSLEENSPEDLGRSVAAKVCEIHEYVDFNFKRKSSTMSPDGLDSYQWKKLSLDEQARFMHTYLSEIDKIWDDNESTNIVEDTTIK